MQSVNKRVIKAHKKTTAALAHLATYALMEKVLGTLIMVAGRVAGVRRGNLRMQDAVTLSTWNAPLV